MAYSRGSHTGYSRGTHTSHGVLVPASSKSISMTSAASASVSITFDGLKSPWHCTTLHPAYTRTVCAHTRTHPHAHTHAHANIRARTHARMRAHTHAEGHALPTACE